MGIDDFLGRGYNPAPPFRASPTYRLGQGMRRRALWIFGLIGIATVFAGCVMDDDARYIYQDGEYGVIGVPRNSPYGRKDYRKQAEDLMRRHFPEGHEIVRAEEVVEGQRVLDKSYSSEFATDPSFSALSQKIDLGKITRQNSTQQKDSLPILESRILYKRKTPSSPQGANGYSSVATLAPELYLDPNEMARCREKIDLADLKKKNATVAEKASDPQTMKASHDAPQSGDSKPK
jgi:hypothetical protein